MYLHKITYISYTLSYMNEIHKTIILGSGPAGLTAGIYSARSNLKPLLFAGSNPGGQLTITTLVENYPGFKDGIMGPQLMQDMIEQSKNSGVEIIYEDIIKVDFSKRPYILESITKTYKAETIIIATGASTRWLGIDSEQKFMGKGVSGCATCDGPFFKDKVVSVIGGGDSAMEEALYLARLAKKVYLIHRKDEFRASQIMQKRVMENSKIEIIYSCEVIEIKGDNIVKSIDIKNNKLNTVSNLLVDGVFIAIGHTPNTQIFKEYIDVDENGYIKVKDFVKTNIDGIFASGDVSDPKYRQAITSAGTGCIAAIEAMHFTENNPL